MRGLIVLFVLTCCVAIADAQSLPAGVPLVIPGPGVSEVSVTPIHIDDPLADPAATIDDFAAAKRHGWPALVLAVAIAAAYGLRSAGKRWPGVGWLSWLNTGKRAFAIACVISVGSAVFDTVVMGGTVYAAGWAALFSFVALANAEAKS